MKCAGITASEGEKRDACRVLVIKPEGKRSLGRYRREVTKRSLGRYRREVTDNVKMDLRK
jgi:hypothetical protein